MGGWKWSELERDDMDEVRTVRMITMFGEYRVDGFEYDGCELDAGGLLDRLNTDRFCFLHAFQTPCYCTFANRTDYISTSLIWTFGATFSTKCRLARQI